MGKWNEGFEFLKTKICKISESKMKEGIYVCPQITQIFEDQDLAQNYVVQEDEPVRHLNRSAETF